jgi:uncharacterized protein (DUF924 family)
MGPRAATALVVVLDQFSRHVYRNAGRAQIEANDRLALSVTEDMLGRGWERALPVPYQVTASLAPRCLLTLPSRTLTDMV